MCLLFTMIQDYIVYETPIAIRLHLYNLIDEVQKIHMTPVSHRVLLNRVFRGLVNYVIL